MRLLAGLIAGALCAAVVSMALRHRTLALPSDPTQSRSSRRLRCFERMPRSVWLQQAGLTATPAQFWLGTVGIALVTFVVLTAATRAPLVAIAPSVGAAALPYAIVSRRRTTRMRAWQAAWPDALRELIAAIVAGRSLPQAVTALGESGPEPLRSVFADFPAMTRVFGFNSALEQIRNRLADATTDRVIEVLIVAHDRGGSIVRDVLEDLVVATTKDLKVLDEIDTDGLETRLNARAVLVLPWLVLLALTLRAGAFRDFYQSRAGILVVCGAAVMGALGAAWLGRLGRQPDEPRVFGGASRVEGPGA
jgi:tight adherence protein B